MEKWLETLLLKVFHNEEVEMNNNNCKLWHYTVSHKQMLIRKINETENIDYYFGDVKYIEIPSVMGEFQIATPNIFDRVYIRTRVKMNKNDKITVVKITHKKYYIVSGIVKTLENKLDRFDLPYADTFITKGL